MKMNEFIKKGVLKVELETRIINNGMWLHRQLAEAENDTFKFTFSDIGSSFVIDKRIKNKDDWVSFAINKKELFQKLIDAIEKKGDKNGNIQ